MTAPAHIEPYTVRLIIEGRLSDPVEVTATLLTAVAERCHQAGAALIGHIKCHGRTSAGSFHCNLTSLRSGARCGRSSMVTELPVDRIDVDLAVLVYGLEHKTLDRLTRAAVAALCRAEGATWAVGHSSSDHRDEDHALGPAERASRTGREETR